MLKLDNNLLNELGLGALPEDQKRAMLQHIYETLELRVGTNLANQMTDQQLAEFEKFIDDGGDANQAQALQWLEANLPNYKQVVNDVFEQLKGEIKQMAPQLVATAQQTAPRPPSPQAMPAEAQPQYAPPTPQSQPMQPGAERRYEMDPQSYQAPQQPQNPYGQTQQPPNPYTQPPQPPQYPPQQAA